MINELLKQVSVLYVEDDDKIRPVVERGIKRRVKELYVAEDGLDGLEKFNKFNPDIVITDIKMPHMDGIQMSKKIKEISSNTPIIIISAHSEADFLFESIEMGIYGYLLKPVDKDMMFTKLIQAAKSVLYEKKELEHRQLIQGLIDLQPSIIFSADDDNKLLFVNKTFLEFFCCKTKISDIEDKELVIDQFLETYCSNIVLESKIEGKDWIRYVLDNPNKNIQIDFTKESVPYSFLVKNKRIEYESGQSNIVLTLTKLGD